MRTFIATYLASYFSYLLCIGIMIAFGYWGNNPLAGDSFFGALVPAVVYFLAERSRFRRPILIATQLVVTGVYGAGMVAIARPQDYVFWLPVFAMIYAIFWLIGPTRDSVLKAFPDWFGGEQMKTSATGQVGS